MCNRVPKCFLFDLHVREKNKLPCSRISTPTLIRLEWPGFKPFEPESSFSLVWTPGPNSRLVEG